MRKWLVPLGVTCAIIILGGAACAVAASLGLLHVARSLPTPRPTAVLTIGKSYWVNALVPPQGLPAGLVLRDASIYNKPGSPITDPSVTVIAVVPNATQLTLAAVNSGWCYVRGTYYPLAEYGVKDYAKSVDGWIECNRLLDYAPTPYPTPNKTPQSP